MRKTDVQSKLEAIPENIERLEFLQARGYQEFRSDFRNIDSALHRLQTSIQALIDIGSYIIAQLGLKTPGFSAEVIEILVEAGFINAEYQERYINWFTSITTLMWRCSMGYFGKKSTISGCSIAHFSKSSRRMREKMR